MSQDKVFMDYKPYPAETSTTPITPMITYRVGKDFMDSYLQPLVLPPPRFCTRMCDIHNCAGSLVTELSIFCLR
ncbi:hypothetical protein J6590_046010 [Homalodisca vitripennis]|nr:hypothetical protein J6590_046010 [Homalodisca vitripennis]